MLDCSLHSCCTSCSRCVSFHQKNTVCLSDETQCALLLKFALCPIKTNTFQMAVFQNLFIAQSNFFFKKIDAIQAYKNVYSWKNIWNAECNDPQNIPWKCWVFCLTSWQGVDRHFLQQIILTPQNHIVPLGFFFLELYVCQRHCECCTGKIVLLGKENKSNIRKSFLESPLKVYIYRKSF